MLYRAYWAIPRTLKTSDGEQVNTVFGMASMLLTILSKEEPDQLIICFDEGDETFRHQEVEAYKEGRAETPDDFYAQIPRVMEMLDACSFVYLSDPKVEADDLLGSYAVAAATAGGRATIVSGDRDVLQCASDQITIAIPHKGYLQAEHLGPKEVEEKYGIRPDQVVDYKGLTGDSSDNLPGVNGIGPKTASTLLQQYDSLENLYQHLDELKPAQREKLERDRDQAFHCAKYAQLLLDLPLPVSLSDLELTGITSDPIFDFFSEMEFSLLLKRFQKFLESDYARERFVVNPDHVIREKPKKEEEQMSLF